MQSSCSPLKKEDDCLKKGCCLFVKKTNVSNVVTAAECVPKALGFKWLSAGDTEPTTGRNLEHPELAEALMSKTEFTQQEWEAFGMVVDDLYSNLGTDHFVKSGDSYFQPAGGDDVACESQDSGGGSECGYIIPPVSNTTWEPTSGGGGMSSSAAGHPPVKFTACNPGYFCSMEACNPGYFCSMDKCLSSFPTHCDNWRGTCQKCTDCTTTPDANGCGTCGLSGQGTDECIQECSDGKATASAPDDNCIACPCGYELDLVEHCKKKDADGECEEWCDSDRDESRTCMSLVPAKDRKKDWTSNENTCKIIKSDCVCTKNGPKKECTCSGEYENDHDGDKTPLGLIWKEVADSSSQPATGTEITNPELAAALEATRNFNKTTWKDFKENNVAFDSWIKVPAVGENPVYFTPHAKMKVPDPLSDCNCTDLDKPVCLCTKDKPKCFGKCVKTGEAICPMTEFSACAASTPKAACAKSEMTAQDVCLAPISDPVPSNLTNNNTATDESSCSCNSYKTGSCTDVHSLTSKTKNLANWWMVQGYPLCCDFAGTGKPCSSGQTCLTPQYASKTVKDASRRSKTYLGDGAATRRPQVLPSNRPVGIEGSTFEEKRLHFIRFSQTQRLSPFLPRTSWVQVGLALFMRAVCIVHAHHTHTHAR